MTKDGSSSEWLVRKISSKSHSFQFNYLENLSNAVDISPIYFRGNSSASLPCVFSKMSSQFLLNNRVTSEWILFSINYHAFTIFKSKLTSKQSIIANKIRYLSLIWRINEVWQRWDRNLDANREASPWKIVG